MKENLEHLLETARKAAGAGAAKINEIYEGYKLGDDIGIREKAKNDPVTVADMSANKVITEIIRSEFRDHAILTEEDSESWETEGYEWVWMIDPLDGTKDFIKANGEFVTMIGLTHFGDPTVGVVIEPSTGLELYACKGMGAYKNWIYQRGMPLRIKISETTDMEKLRLAVSRSHRDQKVDKFMEIMSIQHEIPSGSVGRKVAMIINGAADIYVHPSKGTKLWDTCACDVILSEAGGVLLSGTGEKIKYLRPSQDVENKHGLLASPYNIMDLVIKASRQIWGLD